MKNFINIIDIPSKNLKKIIIDAKKRKNKRKNLKRNMAAVALKRK